MHPVASCPLIPVGSIKSFGEVSLKYGVVLRSYALDNGDKMAEVALVKSIAMTEYLFDNLDAA